MNHIPPTHAAVLDALESIKALQQMCAEYDDLKMARVAMEARLAIIRLIATRACGQ